jgi:hypothetical protein
MIKIFSKWIQHRSATQVVIISTVIFAIFIIFVLPEQAEKSESYSSGVGSIDTKFIYTVDEVYEIAEVYGQMGREAYVNARLTFDTIWPLAYTFFLATTISWFYKNSQFGDQFFFLNLVPIIGLIFDYLENVSISIVMSMYPIQIFWLARITTISTPIKWIFVNGSFIVLLIGILIYFYEKIRRK